MLFGPHTIPEIICIHFYFSLSISAPNTGISNTRPSSSFYTLLWLIPFQLQDVFGSASEQFWLKRFSSLALSLGGLCYAMETYSRESESGVLVAMIITTPYVAWSGVQATWNFHMIHFASVIFEFLIQALLVFVYSQNYFGNQSLSAGLVSERSVPFLPRTQCYCIQVYKHARGTYRYQVALSAGGLNSLSLSQSV